MITLQDNQQYVTKGGRRVLVKFRPEVSHSYKFWVTDIINGIEWSCTEWGTKYADRSAPSIQDIVSKVETSQTSEGDANMDATNLKNLKQNADKTLGDYMKALKDLQDSLPDGVKLMVDGGEFDGSNIGSVEHSETLVAIEKKSDVKAGDILRLVDEVDTTHPRIHLVEQGKDYRVVSIDGFDDPQIVDVSGTGSGPQIDTCGMLDRFRIVRESSDSQGTWVLLSLENRGILQEGTVVRATEVIQRYDGRITLTAGREYTIHSNPDNDGRFIDDAGCIRDTYAFYDGELEVKIS